MEGPPSSRGITYRTVDKGFSSEGRRLSPPLQPLAGCQLAAFFLPPGPPIPCGCPSVQRSSCGRGVSHPSRWLLLADDGWTARTGKQNPAKDRLFEEITMRRPAYQYSVSLSVIEVHIVLLLHSLVFISEKSPEFFEL